MAFIKHRATRSPAENGAEMRLLLAAIPPNSDLELINQTPTVYDFGDRPVYLPEGLRIHGPGSDLVKWTAHGYQHSVEACAFELNKRNTLEGFALESDVKVGQQSQTVGFGSKNAPSSTTALLRDMLLIGSSFVFYTWFGEANRIAIDRTTILAGRIGIMAGKGNGPDSQFVTVTDSNISCDYAARTGAGGDIGPRSIGLFVRGGTATATRTQFSILGSADVDLAAAVASIAGGWKNSKPENFPAGATWPDVLLTDCASMVRGNGAKAAFDLVRDIGVARALRHKGAGPGRVPTVDGAFQVMP